jgi:UDP-N-acetylglucosamine--N-acetylmuramyl-(pentapeptide) pyrophosphoryl-undecaprenol N-acetylglucosamine transferase
MESRLVERAGITFESIPAAGVHGVGLRKLPGNAWRLVQGVPAAARILNRFKPEALFFTGGYVGVPVSIAGRRLPQAVFVPDIEPGLALRLIARQAEMVAVTTEYSRRYYATDAPLQVTGYPLRKELEVLDSTAARRKLGLRSDDPTLLVYGGSRGARSINKAVEVNLEALLTLCQVIHISGELDWPRVQDFRDGLPEGSRARYLAFPYLHEEMGTAFSAASLVISRAGAAALGELSFYGLPAILVPYPHAWRYQAVNAHYLESHQAAVILDDALLQDRLHQEVGAILGNPDRLRKMREASRRLATPGAAEAIASGIARLVQGQDQTHG